MGISPPPLHHRLQRDFHYQQPPPSLPHHLPEINFELVNCILSCSFIEITFNIGYLVVDIYLEEGIVGIFPICVKGIVPHPKRYPGVT